MAATPISNTTFRTMLPEFADTSAYPDALVTTYIGVASNMVNPDRFKDAMMNLAQSLVAAHYITLSVRDQATAGVGGQPGELTGSVASKAIDRVSVSFNALELPGAGDWAMTSYGARWWKLCKLFGAGGLVVC